MPNNEKGFLPRLDIAIGLVFLLPGFVSFLACGYLSPEVASVLENVRANDGAFGSWILLLLGSVVAGVVVNAVRELLLDWIHKIMGVGVKPLDYGLLMDPNRLEAFRFALNATYTFYEIFANTLVAVTFLMIARLLPYFSQQPKLRSTAVMVVVVISLLSLFCSSRSSLRSTRDVLSQILPRNQ